MDGIGVPLRAANDTFGAGFWREEERPPCDLCAVEDNRIARGRFRPAQQIRRVRDTAGEGPVVSTRSTERAGQLAGRGGTVKCSPPRPTAGASEIAWIPGPTIGRALTGCRGSLATLRAASTEWPK